jgi:parallel beta-helix repeat protein
MPGALRSRLSFAGEAGRRACWRPVADKARAVPLAGTGHGPTGHAGRKEHHVKTSFFCGVRWTAIVWAAGLIAMGWLGVSRLDAATIYVCPAGSDANDGLTWPTAKKTVQAGLNAAASDDQVWVAAGTYVENITLKSGVALYGGFAGGESDLAQRNWTTNVTVLDGNQQDRVVSLPLTPGQTARLDGFTIRNGRPYLGGGGILCGGGSPVIANNRITGNNVRPLEWGGGIFCEDGSPTIINNVITGNSASAGGGIYCWDGSPTIANNIIAGNSVYDSGGGICWKSHENLTLVNNTIIGNSASSGGGIYSGSSSFPTITNPVCTVYLRVRQYCVQLLGPARPHRD